MCSAEFAACWKFSKRTGHYKLKCDRVCSVITTKNRLLLLIFFFRKLVFLLILAAGLLWMKDSSLAFLGKTCSYPCRFFLFLCNMSSSARNVSFRNYFLRPIYFINLNNETKLSCLFVSLSVLFDCLCSCLLRDIFFFLSVAVSVRPFFLLVLLSANFPFFLSVCPKLVLSACLSLVSFSPIGNRLAV